MAKRNPGKEISAGDILNFIDRLFDVVVRSLICTNLDHSLRRRPWSTSLELKLM